MSSHSALVLGNIPVGNYSALKSLPGPAYLGEHEEVGDGAHGEADGHTEHQEPHEVGAARGLVGARVRVGV